MSPRKISNKDLVSLLVAVLSLLGILAGAYYSFRGSTASLELSIKTTQTAESLKGTPSATSTLTPSPQPTATPNYAGFTVIGVSEFYFIGSDEQSQFGKQVTSDIFDEITSHAAEATMPIRIIKIDRIVDDANEAIGLSQEFNSAEKFFLIYGGIETLGETIFIEFSIYSPSDKKPLILMNKQVIPQEYEEISVMRINYPAQIGSSVSYVLGREAYSRGDYPDAIKQLTNALRGKNPIENWEIHLYLANALTLSNSLDYPKIENEYQKGIELADDSKIRAIAYGNWGIVCMKHNDTACAEKNWQNAILEDPSLYYAHHNLGILALQRSDWLVAKNYFNAATNANRDFGESYDGLGTALYQLGETDAAVQAWEDAITKSPDNCMISYNLAFGYAEQHNLEDAIKYAKRATGCAPQDAESWELLGQVLQESQMPNEAQEACKRMAELTSDLNNCQSILGTPGPEQ